MDQYGYNDFETEQDGDRAFDFLTPEDVMAELAIGKSTFYRLVRTGELPALRIGHLWRVRREVLLAWKK